MKIDSFNNIYLKEYIYLNRDLHLYITDEEIEKILKMGTTSFNEAFSLVYEILYDGWIIHEYMKYIERNIEALRFINFDVKIIMLYNENLLIYDKIAMFFNNEETLSLAKLIINN